MRGIEQAMASFVLSPHQTAITQASLDRKTFPEGPAGTGKTTADVGRLRHLLDSGIPAGTILVIVSLEH